MNLAKSISADELASVAEKAAHEVMGGDFGRFGGKLSIGKLPIGTMGLIWHDPDFGRLATGEMMEMSTKMCELMRPVIGDVMPTATVFPGGATMGYFPIDPIDFRRF